MTDSVNVMKSLEAEEEELEALELETAKRILLSLSKAVTNMRFYLPNNPLVCSSKSELYQEMTNLLKRWHTASYEITDEEVTYKGTPVYQIEDKANNFFFIFYRDGVRRITFHEGLSSEELNTFLEIIREAVNSSEEETDIVSLLWNGGFTSIEYIAIQTFTGTDTGSSEAPDTGGKEGTPISKGPITTGNVADLTNESRVVSPETSARGPTTEQGTPYGTSASVLAQSTAPPQSHVLNTEMGRTDKEFLKTITPEEIKEKVQVLAQFSPMARFAGVLFDLLNLEEDILERSHLLNLVQDHVKDLALQQEFEHASKTIKKIVRILEDSAFQKGHFHEMLSSFLEKITSIVQSGPMKKKIRDAFPEKPTGVLDFLQVVGPGAIPVLLELVPVAKDVDSRASLRNALSALAVHHISKLAEAVSNQDAHVAREVVAIIGRIGDPKGSRILKSCLRHHDASVRAEAVRALGQIGDSDSTKLILEFLKDPDTEVRILAIKTLDTAKDKLLRQTIRDMVTSRSFRFRPTREKIALIDALRRAKSDDVVPAFTGFFRTGWFRKMEDDSVMVAMIGALASIGTRAARKLLEQGSKSRRKTIAVESFRALQCFEG